MIDLSNCVSQMLIAKQKLTKAKEGRDKEFIQNHCNALEVEIDDLVYKLYSITDEEIKIIEAM